MYLNHQLVPGFPITLRYAEERDRDFLAEIFTEVWARIPETDRTAVLARGYGQITVDVVEVAGNLHPIMEMGGGIALIRAAVDTYPRNLLVHLAARELAFKVDDYIHPKTLTRRKNPRHNIRQRVATILERWGYPAKAEPELTRADEFRIRANSAFSKTGDDRDDCRSQGPAVR